MDCVEGKSVWGLRPEFAEVFVGRESFERLESSGEAVGLEEVCQVCFELVMGVVEASLDDSVLAGSVHAFDLPVGPGMVGLGQSMFDSVKQTQPVEGVATEACSRSLAVLQVCERDAVVGEHGMDAVRNGLDESLEERCCSSHVCPFDEFNHSGLRSFVDGYE